MRYDALSQVPMQPLHALRSRVPFSAILVAVAVVTGVRTRVRLIPRLARCTRTPTSTVLIRRSRAAIPTAEFLAPVRAAELIPATPTLLGTSQCIPPRP